MRKKRILWADDEIDILRAHILFLTEKGYDVTPVNSGQDALESFKSETFDIVFLDEHMPGLSGIETLGLIKEIDPNIPVIMITKSEDEGIMTHAIGKKIADYLIKPVNPNQILLSLKKNLHKDDIVSEATLEGYREEFNRISSRINDSLSYQEWTDIYKKLVYWEIELTAAQSPLLDLLRAQKQEANNGFCKFIKKNYESWIADPENRPLISPELFPKKIFPLLDNDEKVFFILIDNFRLDQWSEIKDLLSNDFTISEEEFFSILPTATQYARNAIFSGLLPSQIVKMYPDLWIDEDEDESKNNNEEALLRTLVDRYRKKYSFSYNKLLTSSFGERFVQSMNELSNKSLNVVVINFVDMLSHARTESKMIRELASDEAAYRSLTRSWFKHSSTMDILRKAKDMGYKIVLTTDHGTIRVKNPLKVIADKTVNTNIRYKTGRNLEYDRKKVYDIHNPERAGLPTPNISTKYIFATGEDFFAYPNNYNHYVSYYTDTFQHGGISMEEMIVPFITLTGK
ncbi:DNA-binding response OmpR family regulator [Dysgonomonas sp. PFB1-18]|uniref:T9SS response regulator signal transducer PorX n=1 Tax=unclassified Dysgonomonas TaxID=2630389 RepID=UPI002475680D|nr:MULTISPECIES: bifunctional response regulator/alkaline phosphatase family protein [unclassified Dysgonomonas]MDH6307282.1 DNA-binding response OmpR family regulator [Dysgonomonas sp. PF1-14]MDH6337200.1 DNA-binding response OmpR family regulator [Dysgonomonas sp. PF1-16]MDH6379124.1 DNA-binding response OmpR family regulator [Dysgonomonas sp. PFB1-18]MDH6396239.1 DNA-binding response OmpR family regulator [Dysgonomonas sp. PF1-23]